MNLHILPDSKFSNTFYENLEEANVLANNTLIVRTNKSSLLFVKHSIPFAKLYSAKFNSLTANLEKYDRVYVHQLSPLMYRWIATHDFRELNWMVWGTDLYNLPFIEEKFYEPATAKYSAQLNVGGFLFRLKVLLTNSMFRHKAYSKIEHVLTWMKEEHAFAEANIRTLNANHQFFFYENEIPYHRLDQLMKAEQDSNNGTRNIRLVVGNSGTPTNNHLDAIKVISESGLLADLHVPVSYGDPHYISFLKKHVSFYKNGKINFIDRFMDFEEYVSFLNASDGLVMNHIRPQGYGNILMMMYLGKPVFFNPRNLSLPDLDREAIQWQPLESISKFKFPNGGDNKNKIKEMFSHEKLINLYKSMFS